MIGEIASKQTKNDSYHGGSQTRGAKDAERKGEEYPLSQNKPSPTRHLSEKPAPGALEGVKNLMHILDFSTFQE